MQSLRFSLEVFAFTGAVFSFADIVFYRSVIDLGRRIVLEGIRLTADLRFVFNKALVSLVDLGSDPNGVQDGL